MSDSSARPGVTQKLLAICGISGPILYTIVVITLGALEPGYSHVTQTMSQLGAAGAANAIVMNTVGFAVLGILMIAFAFGLHRGISNSGRASKIGPALIAVSGAALIMTGVFRCDPGCADISAVGITHSVFAIIAAFGMIFAPLAISQRLYRDSRWQSYVTYSMATVAVALAISAVYSFNFFDQWDGALQRISMGIPLIWIEVMAIRLLRLS